MPTLDALLQAVLDRPDDETPRLAYADYLADHGGAAGLARAEFIRVQCGLARERGTKGYPSPAERSRTAKAFRRYRDAGWFPLGPGSNRGWTVILPGGGREGDHATRCGLAVAVVRRGFVAEIRLSLAVFVGGVCRWCAGRGHVYGDGTSRPACEACGGTNARMAGEPRRLFPQANGTGRTPGLAAALFAAHPVAEVVLTDVPVRLSVDQPGVDHGWQFYAYPGIDRDARYAHMEGGFADRAELVAALVRLAGTLTARPAADP